MFRTHPLLHELERRARALGFTWAALAAEVGIDRTTLAHIRSGRGRLSLGTLHRIAVWFPTDAAIQRSVWEYLLHDVETQKERAERAQLQSRSSATLLVALPPATQDWLRAFVADFAGFVIHGRSLLLTGTNTAPLASALSFLESELVARGIHPLRAQPHRARLGSQRAALLAAPLVLVERLEFASAEMKRVITDRCRFGKVTVASSTGAPIPSSLAGDALHWLVRTIDVGPRRPRNSVDHDVAASR